jgi:hypothetical protein
MLLLLALSFLAHSLYEGNPQDRDAPLLAFSFFNKYNTRFSITIEQHLKKK